MKLKRLTALLKIGTIIGSAGKSFERMEISITVTVLLMLLTRVRVVCGQSANEDCYNDPLEVLNSIKAYPDNYQQLLNAFYPINRAKPSSVIIAYFTNYTDPPPEECSLGTYPWETYPGVNISYSHIKWYMWTTSPIWCEGTELNFLEWGEYLPTMSFYLLFNKSSIFDPPSQIACIKTPAIPIHYPTLGAVTTQVCICGFTIFHNSLFTPRLLNKAM